MDIFVDPSDCAEYPLCYMWEEGDYDHEWEMVQDDPDCGITGYYICVHCETTRDLDYLDDLE